MTFWQRIKKAWRALMGSRDPDPLNYHKITCGVYAPMPRKCDCGAGPEVEL